MKKLVFLASLATLCASSAFADGAEVFKKCVACHGPKAEKSYLNKVPVLTTLDKDTMVENMKKYNAHIMADCAPKNLENYHFYIPADKLDMFVINYIQDDSKTLLSANLVSQNEPQITKFEVKFRSKSDIIRAVYHS